MLKGNNHIRAASAVKNSREVTAQGASVQEVIDAIITTGGTATSSATAK